MAGLLPRPQRPKPRFAGKKINPTPTVVDSGMDIQLPAGYSPRIEGNPRQYNMPGDTDVLPSAAVDAYAVSPHHSQHIDFDLLNRELQDAAGIDRRTDGLLAEIRQGPDARVDDFYNNVHNNVQFSNALNNLVEEVQNAPTASKEQGWLRKAGQMLADADEQVQSRLRVPMGNEEEGIRGMLGTVNNLRSYLHVGNPASSAPRDYSYANTPTGWAMTAGSRGLQAGAVTLAGMGLYNAGSAIGNAFGGKADEQEDNQLPLM